MQEDYLNTFKEPHNVLLSLAPEQSLRQKSTTNNAVNNSSTHWKCHKDILKSKSTYFNALFNNDFQETEASVIFLPYGIFSSFVLDDILYYMYTNSICIIEEEKSDDQNNYERANKLERLESIYLAADYLGMDTLCHLIQEEIIQLTHGLVCYCCSCTFLIPKLLAFTGQNQQNDPQLSEMTYAILKLLIQDPEKTLPTYWTSDSLAQLFIETKSLHTYLESKLFEHVNKNNAIEVLYGCFLAANSHQEEKKILATTQRQIQRTASKLLADHFDFYCTQYPKLLSCVDGITYSYQFLEFLLLSNVLKEMNDFNASSLYKGIVRSLMCRDSVQHTSDVKHILQSAKTKVIRYIGSHLSTIKQLNTIDKTVVEQLAQDLGIPRYWSITWDHILRSRLCTIVFGKASFHLNVGQRVQLLNRPVITTEQKNEEYVGIELDRSVGSNDGSLNGKRYFSTLPNKGIFVKQSQVILI
ncbi:uncharacterized protein BX663DRAFT_508434 [Cokeromyces recurvatus]|uniref:uncharacterized protein n=1 Tax=Cokeromyces recurvatus TaxID=90255 RepID=UPI00221E7DE1|nr:uncharacterized protein BX663DRAFT_508434 [Cokeromyces recurvatus]KAI7903390.1 hypothetical protein BX663DRAFT_508434 [Cokeromyces recurvatus]